MPKTAVTARSANKENKKTADILQKLADKLGPQKFNAWFKTTTTLEIHSNYAKLNVPNPFVASWIENHFRRDIEKCITDSLGGALELMICVDSELSKQFRRRQLDNQATMVSRSTSGKTSAAAAARYSEIDRPAPLRHNLDSFVVGQSNQLAYSAALKATSGRDRQYSPLFIHGPSGLGKTHLLQGICNTAAKRNNGRPVRWRYVSGEQFTNEFVAALKSRKIEQFRDRYRKLDLLAIDDVHFLAAKQATQEEFLHTFNAIDSLGKQVVMASDTHPKFLGQLSEQLTSRFLSGMVVKIDSPDRKTRRQILSRKAELLSIKVDDEVIDFIAMNIQGNVRELEGALVKLAALASLENRPITRQLASEALSDHLARTATAITLGDIETHVSSYFGVTPADLHSSRRTKTISLARMTAMTLARRHTQMSFPEIARHMGKNHSSVILAVKKMETLNATDSLCKWQTPSGEKTIPAKRLMEIFCDTINSAS